MRSRLLSLTALAIVLTLTGCGGAAPEAAEPRVEILVSAAASLTDALTEAKESFEAHHSQIAVTYTFGSSGALAQQIEQGAPVDLFIPAAPDPMERLVEQGLVDGSAVQTAAVNEIVLIRNAATEGLVKGWRDLTLPGVERIAIGNPQHVPAGQYTKAVLEHLGLWTDVTPRLIMGEDARQVLNHVASGEVDAGFVYATDAATSDSVAIIAEAPAGSHPPISYPVAPIKNSQRAAEAEAFAQFLLSDQGRVILAKYGFGAGI